ncbi:MAG: hypothetical protein LBI27_04285 [Clostridiales bacterium]|jgi:hypothetical protein|nr:hypothetical protein [Clostridiales bacterium]
MIKQERRLNCRCNKKLLFIAIIMLLTCCGQSTEPSSVSEADEVDADETMLISEEIALEEIASEEIGDEPEQPIINRSGCFPWQDEYAEILRDYGGRIIGEYLYEAYSRTGGMFSLYDIDMNGVPELIIWGISQGGFYYSHAAYTYTEEGIVPLELAGIYGRGSLIFPAPNNIGFIATSGESGYSSFSFISMEERYIRVDVRAFEDWTPRQSGLPEFHISMYYLKGIDNVTSTELPEILHDSHMDSYEEWLSFGYTHVSEEEYRRVLYDVFGFSTIDGELQIPYEEGIWLHETNEENINIIYDYTPELTA